MPRKKEHPDERNEIILPCSGWCSTYPPLIVIHFRQTLEAYASAAICPGREMAVPVRCPHGECGAEGRMIRWGRYQRYGRTGFNSVLRIYSGKEGPVSQL